MLTHASALLLWQVFLEHENILPTRVKQRAITTYFSHATGVDGLGALLSCQVKLGLPKLHPVKDNDTRWSSGHDQMEWFRVSQKAVQHYDCEHARKAGDIYKQNQMDIRNWEVNTQGVAVLQPIADWTQHLQVVMHAPRTNSSEQSMVKILSPQQSSMVVICVSFFRFLCQIFIIYYENCTQQNLTIHLQ